MTIEGEGIASVAGKRVFIAGAITGETVSFRRVRAKRNYDEAQLLGVEQPAAERVEPRCRYFGTCGGCSLQHLSPEGQLRLKQSVLAEALRRIGQVEPDHWLMPIADSAWGYRRRARLSVRDVQGKGRVLVGFSERGNPYVCDMLSCEVLHPAVATLIEPLSALIGALSLRRQIPQVEGAVADNATVLVMRVLGEPSTEDMSQLRAFRDRHGVRLLLQRSDAASLRGLDSADEAPLWYDLPGELRLRFGPVDFIQVNAAVNERMISRAIELLQLTPGMRLLDLFCGIGNFTLPLARHVDHALGVEGDAGVVERARANSAANGIMQASFAVADLSRADSAAAWSGQRFDAVLLDPPRAGAAAILPAVATTGAARILYVSCHPGTLARDAGTLTQTLGYRLVSAGILDMFPATSHVESMALFERS